MLKQLKGTSKSSTISEFSSIKTGVESTSEFPFSLTIPGIDSSYIIPASDSKHISKISEIETSNDLTTFSVSGKKIVEFELDDSALQTEQLSFDSQNEEKEKHTKTHKSKKRSKSKIRKTKSLYSKGELESLEKKSHSSRYSKSHVSKNLKLSNSSDKDSDDEFVTVSLTLPIIDKNIEKTRRKNISHSPNSINIISKHIMANLYKQKHQIRSGCSANVYRVPNYISKDEKYLTLKVFKSSYLKVLNESRNDYKPTWNEEDDDLQKGKRHNEINIDVAKEILSEYEILKNLDHPNIIKVYGFYFGNQKINTSILLEYCIYNLEQAISGIEDHLLVGIIYEICSAMDYIHQNNIVHRDLKMKNILINSEKHAKICDFGLSKNIDFDTLTSMSSPKGTFHFMAPEIFKKNDKCNEKIDVYAFGVVMYFILTKGKRPEYNGIGKYSSLEIPNEINSLSGKIIKSCWSLSPEKRPSFAELIHIIEKNNFMLIDGISHKIPSLKRHLDLI